MARPAGRLSRALAPPTTHGCRWARSRFVTIRRSTCSTAATLSKAIDRAIAGAFVTVKPARRHAGDHDTQGREPPPVHDHQPGCASGYVGGLAAGSVRGRRRRPGTIGAPADPGGHRVPGRASRDQRPLIATATISPGPDRDQTDGPAAWAHASCTDDIMIGADRLARRSAPTFLRSVTDSRQSPRENDLPRPALAARMLDETS